jgi:Protein of unknown function (DUF3305)
MIEEQMTIGLVLERRELGGEWGGVAWRPITIFADAPDVAPWTPLGGTKAGMRFYAGAFPISVYSTDTANYRDNLSSEAPKLWVVMRREEAEPPVTVLLVTADPAEGEGNTEAGNNIVETIDMPVAIAGAIAAFIEAHHVERPIIKRRRDNRPFDVRWRDGSGGGADGGGKKS